MKLRQEELATSGISSLDNQETKYVVSIACSYYPIDFKPLGALDSSFFHSCLVFVGSPGHLEAEVILGNQNQPQSNAGTYFRYDEESDHSNKAVRKTPEIESGHKVSEEVK